MPDGKHCVVHNTTADLMADIGFREDWSKGCIISHISGLSLLRNVSIPTAVDVTKIARAWYTQSLHVIKYRQECVVAEKRRRTTMGSGDVKLEEELLPSVPL